MLRKVPQSSAKTALYWTCTRGQEKERGPVTSWIQSRTRSWSLLTRLAQDKNIYGGNLLLHALHTPEWKGWWWWRWCIIYRGNEKKTKDVMYWYKRGKCRYFYPLPIGFFKIHFLRSTQKQALSKTDFKMHDYACNNYTRQSLNLDGPIKCQVVIFKVLSASKSLRDFSAN